MQTFVQSPIGLLQESSSSLDVWIFGITNVGLLHVNLESRPLTIRRLCR